MNASGKIQHATSCTQPASCPLSVSLPQADFSGCFASLYPDKSECGTAGAVRTTEGVRHGKTNQESAGQSESQKQARIGGTNAVQSNNGGDTGELRANTTEGKAEQYQTREHTDSTPHALVLFSEEKPISGIVEQLLRTIIQLGGGKYIGIQHGGKEPLILFNDSRNSTLALPLSTLVREGAEAVRNHIRKAEDEWTRIHPESIEGVQSCN